ncbi:hypothetical protein CK203_090774 [Vitis vinifera]|uniref:Uncharacterized protein n=1 Tax=Vitis vinifera TaxID=29760 RepID=A0A438BTZ0_VITVI|nr:hypothetical protein CK203_090774 [Vitis vinifera]
MALNLRASFKERQHKGLSESLPAAPPPVKRTRPEVSHEELVSDAHTIIDALFPLHHHFVNLPGDPPITVMPRLPYDTSEFVLQWGGCYPQLDAAAKIALQMAGGHREHDDISYLAGAKGEKKERKVAKAKARRIREEKEIAKAKCKDVEYKRDQLKELGKLRAVFEA